MEKFILSIIVPTRNRPQTLKFALESIKMKLSIINYELIIASNGESLEADLLNIPVELLQCAKIVRSETRLSMGENWRYGFGFASGKWVHVIGDDDVVSLRNPQKLLEILSRDDLNGIVLRYGTFKWRIDAEEMYIQEFFWQPEETLEVQKIESNLKILDSWEELHPGAYPNATGGSFITREYLCDLERKGILFSAVSPDWFTGAYFAFSNSEYLKLDLLWASIGAHPESSIFQMKYPKSAISQKEAKVQRYKIHKNLCSLDNTFPTTWLIRLDSIIRARESLGLDTSISEYRLIKNALDTTPRYVHKVGFKLMTDKNSRIPITVLLMIPALTKSLLKRMILPRI